MKSRSALVLTLVLGLVATVGYAQTWELLASTTLSREPSQITDAKILRVMPVVEDFYTVAVQYTYELAPPKVLVYSWIWEPGEADYSFFYSSADILATDVHPFKTGGILLMGTHSNENIEGVVLIRSEGSSETQWASLITETVAGVVEAPLAVEMLPNDEFLVFMQCEQGPVVQHYSPGGSLIAEQVVDGIGEGWDLAYAGWEDRYLDDFRHWVVVSGSEGSAWLMLSSLEVTVVNLTTYPWLLSTAEASPYLGVFGIDGRQVQWDGQISADPFKLDNPATAAMGRGPELHAVSGLPGGGFQYEQRDLEGHKQKSLKVESVHMEVQSLAPIVDSQGNPNWNRLILAGTELELAGMDSGKVDLKLVLIGHKPEYVIGDFSGGYEYKTIELLPAYPNPFNAGTNVRFALAERQEVEMSVYDVLGRLVANPLPRQTKQAGYHTVRIDGSRWSTGIYILLVSTESGEREQQRITLMK